MNLTGALAKLNGPAEPDADDKKAKPRPKVKKVVLGKYGKGK